MLSDNGADGLANRPYQSFLADTGNRIFRGKCSATMERTVWQTVPTWVSRILRIFDTSPPAIKSCGRSRNYFLPQSPTPAPLDDFNRRVIRIPFVSLWLRMFPEDRACDPQLKSLHPSAHRPRPTYFT